MATNRLTGHNERDEEMAKDTVTLTIDEKTVTVSKGTTLLEAARAHGIDIPTICHHEATTPNGLCRLCVVEVEGQRCLQPACIVECSDGAVVHTRSQRVDRARRTILEMLYAAVDLSQAPEILQLIDEYGCDRTRFPEAEARALPFLDDNPFYVRDYSKCLLCWRCVQVCADDAQYAFALTLGARGFETHITTFYDEPMPATTCVFCGQCVGVCPTNAIKPKVEWGLEQGFDEAKIREITRKGKRRRQES
jgi:predicted molibdopterin-dependent oxidoreductase YjgC